MQCHIKLFEEVLFLVFKLSSQPIKALKFSSVSSLAILRATSCSIGNNILKLSPLILKNYLRISLFSSIHFLLFSSHFIYVGKWSRYLNFLFGMLSEVLLTPNFSAGFLSLLLSRNLINSHFSLRLSLLYCF